MANKDYDDIAELLTDLEDDVSTILLTDLDREVKEIYKEQVNLAYSSYEPSYYIRRYDRNGGFADESNWQSDISKKRNGFEYTLENEALAVGEDRGDRLDMIIEEGIYQYTPNPGKREVYQNTQDYIDDNDVVEKVLDKSLKNKGWD